MARLTEKYKEEIVPSLMKDFSYKSIMQVPKIKSIVLNVGMGSASQDVKPLESAAKELATIAGQKAVITRAKKSIAGFKLRENTPVGCKVTLRGNRMYDFYERLVSFALPRVRDFKGLPPKAFDGRGNYTIGLKEQLIFPEIDFDKIEKIKGMNITITTTAQNDEQGRCLLTHMGLPIRK